MSALGRTREPVNVRSIRRSVRAPRVTEGAIDKIRERIVSGAWGPGDRLPKESELAAELGLSRNSLREAVRALSQLRVLEVKQGDGTYVSSLEPGLLLVSAGFDAHEEEDLYLVDMHVTDNGFRELAKRCAALAPRIGAVLEGGYNLATLPRLVSAALEGFSRKA